ncbi:MAG TPA: PIN domain-containing protein [Solirubrobacteraceae bacterium]|jgi:predicted nucleic acid-binding protein|nr:PIN domain-containing protein [Solirubrobacteraceae bacterium]
MHRCSSTSAITGLLQRPNVRAPSEQEGFWDIYAATADNQTRGNHVPDAHLAALMRQHGVRIIYTRDRDLHRYEAIDSRSPFT